MTGSVRKRGKKWYYYFDVGTIDGKRKRIERVGGNTKKEANDSLRIALNEYNNCGSVFDEINITVSDYFDFWFKEYVLINCKHYTQVNYNSMIKNHIKPALGIYKLKSLTPAILQNFLNNKYTEGYAKDTLTGFKGLLTGALRMAVYPYKYIKESPMQYVTLPKYDISITQNKIKTITLDEFYRISNRFPVGHKLNLSLQIAFHTGLRAGEVCGLTWDNIDFENKTLTVDKVLITKKDGISCLQSPKTKASYRTICIGDTLVNILKKSRITQKENKLKYGEFYISDDDKIEYSNNYVHLKNNFICTAENGEVVNTNSFKHLSEVVNKQLMINFNFHILRHTHATMLLENGANLKEIQHRLGHSKLATTMDTYSHVTKKMQRDTVDIFERIIK